MLLRGIERILASSVCRWSDNFCKTLSGRSLDLAGQGLDFPVPAFERSSKLVGTLLNLSAHRQTENKMIFGPF